MREMKFIIFLSVAFIGFTLLFSGIRFHFWWQMAGTAGGLACTVILYDPELRRQLIGNGRRESGYRKRIWTEIGLGILSAAVLYIIFWIGNSLSRLVFGFASSGISSVYEFKTGTPVWVIALLIALIIGPAEEIVWRGMIQSRVTERAPRWVWIHAAFLYSMAHLGSLNLMLILAALVCGLFWGWMYQRFRSLRMNMVSHVIWDMLVFLVLPFK